MDDGVTSPNAIVSKVRASEFIGGVPSGVIMLREAMEPPPAQAAQVLMFPGSLWCSRGVLLSVLRGDRNLV